MGKIICEVCGTSYPDTAEQCPICGCTREAVSQMLGDDLTAEQTLDTKAEKSKSKSKKKEIFDFDEADSQTKKWDGEETTFEETDEEEGGEDEEKSHPNIFVVILLSILILSLIAATGFLVFRYILPNLGDDTPAQTIENVQTDPVVTVEQSTGPAIPCESLVLSSGTKAVLKGVGGKFLLHVNTVPADTTDKIVFTSADESIATVTEGGRVEAVAVGETVVTITCGTQTIECQVVVQSENGAEQTQPTEQNPEAGDTEPSATGEAPNASAPTTPAQQPKPGEVTLKLKKKDITLGVGYIYQLMLDCGLEQNQVEWSSEHPYIASVDAEGNVRARQRGITVITAKLGDQEVSCIVRCKYK